MTPVTAMPYFSSGIDDGVAADHDGARFPGPLRPALEDLAEDLEIQPPLREPDDVEGGDRIAAHRVDVAQARWRRRSDRTRTGRPRSA